MQSNLIFGIAPIEIPKPPNFLLRRTAVEMFSTAIAGRGRSTKVVDLMAKRCDGVDLPRSELR
eukprot:COSAG06_NODE_137_length_22365_cov_49.346313_16_plen_63_part_00